jgi:hypothetical protein
MKAWMDIYLEIEAMWIASRQGRSENSPVRRNSGGFCRRNFQCRVCVHKREESRQGRLKLQCARMSYHARTSILVHYVFTTKNREASIAPEMQPRLWSYIGGIARTNKMKALAVGGVADHCHVLLSLPPTIAIAKAVQLIKSGSSK